MRNNIKLLKKMLEKIKNTPDDIIEKAIDELSEELDLEEISYNLSTNYAENQYNNFYIERESKKCKENLLLAA